MKLSFVLYISSSYAKILGETKFEPREFPRSGSKPIDVKERREKKRESESQLLQWSVPVAWTNLLFVCKKGMAYT